jgi:peptide/nickel transport system substrate-binding protein
VSANPRLGLGGVMLVGGIVLLALAGTTRLAAAGGVPRGGTFRIIVLRDGFDSVDPAQAYMPASWALMDVSCALLLRRPDRPPPAGYRPVPEVAAGYPTVSDGGKTYRFTIRPGFRFSDGSPLTARNFAAAIGRLRNPAVDSPGAQFARDVVGARALGPRTLVIRLSASSADFLARLTMPFFCPVPLGLPNDPEGIGAPFSGAGPYYVASWNRGGELVAVRNPHYRGSRPQHVDRYTVRESESPDLFGALREVERGEADWFAHILGVAESMRAELIGRYGVNKSQYFVQRAPTLWYLALNTERPLFKNNARLRQAVNFAIDRPAVLRTVGPRSGNPTDQLLPPTMPGFRNAHLYPLKHPNLSRAKALARGSTRNGKAVLYVFDIPARRVAGDVIRRNLAQIGLAVDVKTFPPSALYSRVGTRGEPYDIVFAGWGADYIDPGNFLSLLDGRTIRDRGNNNFAYFDSARFNRELDRANRLDGDERRRALGELDIRVLRDEAPIVPLYHPNNHLFVSKRVGCIVLNNYVGTLNLGAVCLKR